MFVADEQLYLSITQDPDNVHLLDDMSAMIVPFRGRPEVHEAAVGEVRALLAEAGRLAPRALLVRNPYQADDYEVADDAIEAFSIAKYHAFANVSRLLGATEVRFLEARAELERADFQARVAALFPVGSGDAEATRNVVKKIEDRLGGHLHFTGGTPDPESASDYLRRSNLTHDPVLRSLVEMRTGANLITRYEFTLNGTRESTSNLSSALQIANSGPLKALEIGAKFSMMAQSIRDVEIKTEITF